MGIGIFVKSPAATLPSGWFWIDYNDGSGCLEGPSGKSYFLYDRQTCEYRFDSQSSWNLFCTPVQGRYIDLELFKAYAEKEIMLYAFLTLLERWFCDEKG